MNIIILEDQTSDRDTMLAFLEKYSRQTGYELTALPCGAPGDLPQELSCADAALLDIIIDGRAAGVEAARSFRAQNWKGPIIFLTTSRDYYAEGFEVDAVHYLVKPFTYEAFTEAMERLIRRTGRPRRTVTLSLGRRELNVPEDEILYVEVYGRETLLHTQQEEVRVLMPLKEIEALLEGGPFLRCFRSCIVNMDHIAQVDHEVFVLSNNARVPISMRNKAEIREKYLEYRFEKLRRNQE